MPKTSAGLLVYRRDGSSAGEIKVLIVHPGGPYWANKDEGAWSIPKGEYEPGDEPKECARREFEEELGVIPPRGRWIDLGEGTQKNGKRVRAWAVEGDVDVSVVHSNAFEMEWPPRSGRTASFPEVDRAEWVNLEAARKKLVFGQTAFLDRLIELAEDAIDIAEAQAALDDEGESIPWNEVKADLGL